MTPGGFVLCFVRNHLVWFCKEFILCYLLSSEHFITFVLIMENLHKYPNQNKSCVRWVQKEPLTFRFLRAQPLLELF